jgi:hypothetical protein
MLLRISYVMPYWHVMRPFYVSKQLPRLAIAQFTSLHSLLYGGASKGATVPAGDTDVVYSFGRIDARRLRTLSYALQNVIR